MKRMLPWILASLVLAPITAEADDQAPGQFSLDDVRTTWHVLPTGADVSYSLGPWTLTGGGGFELLDFDRNRSSGDPGTGGPASWLSMSPGKWAYADGTAKLRYTWTTEWADFWLGGGANGYGNLGFGPDASGAFKDWNGGTYAFLQTGLRQDRTEYNTHRLESGTLVEAEAAWSPSWFSIRGTDFYRLRLATSAYVPLWDVAGPNQLFSGLLALRADVRWLDGKSVPIPELTPTEVRGYYHLYDAKLLSVGTAELRMRLPSWYGAHDVVPVGFGFVDAGSYWGYADSRSAGTKGGWLVGTGIGGGLELFGVATPTLTLGIPLVSGDTRFWWAVNLQLKF
jgi:hypothetical protein